MIKNNIYLDYNATAPLREGVLETMTNALTSIGNASSIHTHGRTARKIIEQARDDVATLIGARAENVFFNSGATEGNNTIIHAYSGQGVVISNTEHPSILEQDHDRSMIRVTNNGIIDLEHFEHVISTPPPPALVSVMMVNNETGVIQPVNELCKICHMRGIKFHTDATQAAGRIPVDLFMMNADYMTLSAHKIGGPQGVGALITTNNTPPPIMLHGGGQEKRMRAGTENVAGIAGFGAAAKHAYEHMDSFLALKNTQEYIESNIKRISESIVIFGENVDRVVNTTCIGIPNANAETLLIAFDLEGISLGSGSACSSGKVTHSHVLTAMNIDNALINGALRISYGWHTTREEIERFLTIFEKIIKRIL